MVYNVYMIRHQIYLTPQLKREIQIQARKKGKSEAEVIRDVLEDGLKIKKGSRQGSDEVLFKITGIAKKGPKDLSSNLFDYLYGDKSPNYGKNAPKLTKAEERRIEQFLNAKPKENTD